MNSEIEKKLNALTQRAYERCTQIMYPHDKAALRSQVEAAAVKASCARTLDEWHSLQVMLTRLQKAANINDRDLSRVSDSVYGAVEKLVKCYQDGLTAVREVIEFMVQNELDGQTVRIHITPLAVHAVALQVPKPPAKDDPEVASAAEQAPPPATSFEPEAPAQTAAESPPAAQNDTPREADSPDAPIDEPPTFAPSDRRRSGGSKHYR